MKQLCIIAAAIFLLFPVARSQADDNGKSKASGFAPHSVLLGIDDLLKLSDFLSGNLSYKYHLAPSNALRIGIAFFATQQNDTSFEEGTTQHPYSNNSLIGSGTLRVQYLRYLAPTAMIKPYTGIGPFVEERYDRETTVRYDYDAATLLTSILHSDTRTTSTSLGISAPFGLEWLFAKKFSLIVEYSVSAYLHWTKIVATSTNYPVQYRNSDGWQFKPGGIRLGLTIYL
jgi:YD repeat-containing protein